MTIFVGCALLYFRCGRLNMYLNSKLSINFEALIGSVENLIEGKFKAACPRKMTAPGQHKLIRTQHEISQLRTEI